MPPRQIPEALFENQGTACMQQVIEAGLAFMAVAQPLMKAVYLQQLAAKLFLMTTLPGGV